MNRKRNLRGLWVIIMILFFCVLVWFLIKVSDFYSFLLNRGEGEGFLIKYVLFRVLKVYYIKWRLFCGRGLYK